MLNIEELIDGAMSLPEEKVDKRKVIKILADSIRHNCNEHDTYIKIYKEIYGNELIPKLCSELVNSFNNDVKWTIDDTNSVANKLDYDFNTKPYTQAEFNVAMHKSYHDHCIPLKKSGKSMDPVDWGRLADYYFTADGEPRSKLVDFYFWWCNHN